MSTELVHTCHNIHANFNRVFGNGYMLLALPNKAENIAQVKFNLYTSDNLIGQNVGIWINATSQLYNSNNLIELDFDEDKTWKLDIPKDFFKAETKYYHNAEIIESSNKTFTTTLISDTPSCSQALAVSLVVISTISGLIAIVLLVLFLDYCCRKYNIYNINIT